MHQYIFLCLNLLLLLYCSHKCVGACGQQKSKDVTFIRDQNFATRQHSVGPTLQAILDSFINMPKQKGEKIVGGYFTNDTSGGRLCWQVLMEFVQMPGQVRCGGSIIGSRTILTAAHCVSGNRVNAVWSADSLMIMVGALDDSYDGTNPSHGAFGCARRFNIAKIIRHPQYDQSTLNNDIALVILNQDIDLSSKCACAVCLSRAVPATGEWCINSGFGMESESGAGDPSPLPLKYIYQQILANNKDKRCLYDDGTDPNNFICAGGVAGIDNCYGDSGGPLACFNQFLNSYYVAGVVSYAIDVCGSGQGSRYTNVNRFLDWIVANSNQNVAIS